jgi:WD40 repeat protein
MTLIRKIDGLEGTVSSLNWHPKQHTLAIAAYGGITLADRDQQELRTLAWRGAPLVAAWSPDGKMIAHGNQDATVHFWYPETNVELQMSGFPAKVGQIAWEFTSRTLATGGGPAAYLWDCSGKGPEGSRPKMLQGHRDVVTALVYQQRGFLLASGGRDGRLCVWQPANRTPLIAGAEFPEAEISSLAWSPNDQFLAVGTSSGGIGIFKVK